jgi:N utilization substance protein A
MALVLLPGLNNLIEDISEEKKLAPQVVEAALREALLKGYERYRRTLYLGISEDPFEEDYFSNFDVALDLEEEGYRVLASKIIVEEVESDDHQISIEEVRQVAEDAQTGDTVVLDVTPEKEEFGRMAAATTKQVLAQKLRDQQRRMIQEEFADLEDPVLTARVIRFERQSVIMAVSSGLGRPEVEAELPRRDQLPNDNYRGDPGGLGADRGGGPRGQSPLPLGGPAHQGGRGFGGTRSGSGGGLHRRPRLPHPAGGQ